MNAFILIVVITSAAPYPSGLRPATPAPGLTPLPVVSMQRFEDFRACDEALKYLGQVLRGVGANAACRPAQYSPVTPEKGVQGEPSR